MLSNLHTHTAYSDGSGKPEEYVAEAVRQEFQILGFSDHSPVPFENNFAIKNDTESFTGYIDEITRLKAKYSKPQILLGLEVDYIPGITGSLAHYRENHSFDYFIGSVHLVRNQENRLWFIDGPSVKKYDDGLIDVFGGDIRKGVVSYFRQIREMTASEKPDIIGHLDKIRMHNHDRYFTENDDWYLAEINETLDVIRDAGSVIEVNTRGIYKKRSESLYPSVEVLKKIHRLNIPVIISSDAHKPHEISSYFPETEKIFRDIGFKSQWMLISGEWKEIALTP